MKVGTGGNLGLSRAYHKKLFWPLFYRWWNCPLRLLSVKLSPLVKERLSNKNVYIIRNYIAAGFYTRYVYFLLNLKQNYFP